VPHGQPVFGQIVTLSRALTPLNPMELIVTKVTTDRLDIAAILHLEGKNQAKPIPVIERSNASTVTVTVAPGAKR
jgi:hypothetical protein